MPKKKKKRAKKKYSKRPERLDTQLKFFVDANQFRTRAQVDAAVKRARDHFQRTGRSIAGVRIVARWRNPDRTDPGAARWKDTEESGQSLLDYWQTIVKRRR